VWTDLTAPMSGGRPFVVRYGFDRGVVDPVTPVAAAGGRVGLVRHAGGWAVRFPNRCTDAPIDCPRVILEGGRLAELNPGPRSLRFGASIRMAPTDTADGANVVQKGFSVGGGTQYKLQVDGFAGQPSCVLASATTIYRVIAPVDVADGRWHALGCHRFGPNLAISVDGTTWAAIRVPRDLSIVNNEPLRIGGKGTKPDNDQFAGSLDEVYVAIDAN
jgi:hypothetical protein